MRNFLLLSLLSLMLPGLAARADDKPQALDNPAAKPAEKPAIILRVSVVNGLARRGPWPALATAFAVTGAAQVKTLAGQRDDVTSDLREGRADIALMHKGDEAIELVKDGVAKEAIPWAASGFIIAGPKADPAGVRGAKDAVEALRRILKKSSPLVAPDGQGTRAMFEQTLAKTGITPPPEWKALDAGDDTLTTAAAANAYFFAPAQREGLDDAAKRNMEVFIAGDPALRLEFVALISTESPNAVAANALLKFLTDPRTGPHFKRPADNEGRWMDLHPLNLEDKAK